MKKRNPYQRITYAGAVCVSYIREAAARVSCKGILQKCEMFSGKTYNHFAIARSHAAEVTKKNYYVPHP